MCDERCEMREEISSPDILLSFILSRIKSFSSSCRRNRRTSNDILVMSLFNYFFSAIYYFSTQRKSDHTPRLTAIVCVLTIQFFITILPIIILQNYFYIGIIHINIAWKYLAIPVAFIWELILEFYYNKRRAEELYERFKEKPNDYKKRCLMFSLLFIIGPLIVFTITGIKNS